MVRLKYLKTYGLGEFNQKYKFAVVINGNLVEFYVDDKQVMSVNMSDFNIDATEEFQPFTGFWAGDNNSRTVKGYVDNVKVMKFP